MRIGVGITLAVLLSASAVVLPAGALCASGDIMRETVYPPAKEDVDVNVSDAAMMPGGGVVFTGTIAREDGDRDMLTVRYRPDWTIVWALTYDMSWFDVSNALSVDPKGDVTVAGAVQDTDNPSDAFFSSYYTDYRVIRYTPDGALAFEAGSSGYDRNNVPVDAAPSPDGGVYVTGSATNPQQTYDYIYTLRYGPDGTDEWDTFEDLGVETHVAGLAVTRDGSLWVAGYAREGRDGQFDILLVRYDPDDGKYVKQVKFDDLYFDRTAAAVTSDIRGDVVVAGTAMNEHGGSALTLKYSQEGRLLWEYVYGTDGTPTHVEAVTTDSMGRVYAAGRVEKGNAIHEVLLYVLTSDGELLDERTYSFERESQPVALMLDGSNDLTMALASVSPDSPGEAMFVKVDGWPLDRVRLTLREAAGLGADIRLHGDLMPVYGEIHRLIMMSPVEQPDAYHFVIGPGGGMPSGEYYGKPLRLEVEPIIYETSD